MKKPDRERSRSGFFSRLCSMETAPEFRL
ncbi:hypothetical protein C8P63_14217, partial [Melghirimyces profundicolus]